jgi:hypothetical protein
VAASPTAPDLAAAQQGDPANAAPATSAPTTPAEPATPPDPTGLGDAGKRAIHAERAARQKAEQDLAALRKQVDDANKTAEERAADQLREAQESAAESAAKALRYEVAAEVGVPLAMASRLVGKTREEIHADAEEFLAQIPQAPSTPAGPRPDPAQGPRPQSPQAAEDAEYEQFKARLFPNHHTERA